MEELCKAMSEAGMTVPLLIGGATTSAVHTAVKLAPLYDHVFYGADASAAAVLAKKCMMDRKGFEAEQHAEQKKIRELYHKPVEKTEWKIKTDGFAKDTYARFVPESIDYMELPVEEVLPWFDWKMLHAIWGVRYGSAVPEVAELMQLRRDAEDELAMANFKIHIAAHFYDACSENDDIVIKTDNGDRKLPMLREEAGKMLSLSDFIIPAKEGKTSPFGVFAISVKANDAHEEGCCCPACSNKYEDLVGRTVRMTVAEAASCWLDNRLKSGLKDDKTRIIKPAAGYASCPDHTLKKDILELLPQSHRLGLRLTESYAMIPESSICGMILLHPDASYPSIRRISQKQYDDYVQRRGMSAEDARIFLRHLLK
jgi:5-methyltetrahydrofolate--homocysteine methyltransferase